MPAGSEVRDTTPAPHPTPSAKYMPKLVRFLSSPESEWNFRLLHQLAEDDFSRRIRSWMPASNFFRSSASSRWSGNLRGNCKRLHCPVKDIHLNQMALYSKHIRPHRADPDFAGARLGGHKTNRLGQPTTVTPAWHFIDFVTAVFAWPMTTLPSEVIADHHELWLRLNRLFVRYLGHVAPGTDSQSKKFEHEYRSYILAVYEAITWLPAQPRPDDLPGSVPGTRERILRNCLVELSTLCLRDLELMH